MSNDATAPQPTTPAAPAGGGDVPPDGPGDEAAEEETPWWKNPWFLAAMGVLAALIIVLIIANSGDDDGGEEDITSIASGFPTATQELIDTCLAGRADAAEACEQLADRLSEREKEQITQLCIEGEAEACRLLELVGLPVPTPPTTAPPATESAQPPTIELPPPDPGEPTPPEPTIPELPDPTPEELIEACLADDGETSDQACEYLADNITDSQLEFVRDLCERELNADACKLLERMGFEVTPPPSTTTAA